MKSHLSPRRLFRRLLTITVGCFVTLAASFAASGADVNPRLVLAAERDGQVRIIVGLDTQSPTISPAKKERLARQLSDKGGLGLRAAGIKIAGDQLMANVSQATVKKARRFKQFPMMSMVVDAQEMQRIANAPETAWIAEDRIHKPSLAQSVPLVEGNLAHTQGFTGAGQAIAVLDTGVDASHPFLSPRVISEGCFSSNSSDTSSVCPNGQEAQTGPGAAGRRRTSSGCKYFPSSTAQARVCQIRHRASVPLRQTLLRVLSLSCRRRVL